jgi:hypothetical protein
LVGDEENFFIFGFMHCLNLFLIHLYIIFFSNLFSVCVSLHRTRVQEKATKWQDNVEMDGLTTNGVLIMHPKGKFCGGNAKCGLWRETSLGGDVFSLRESRSAQQKGQPVSIHASYAFKKVSFPWNR